MAPITRLARGLRADQLRLKRSCWARLRGKRLGGFKFRRQEPLGPFGTDFVCLDRCLVIEVDGSVHDREGEAARDEAGSAWLVDHGYRVLRVKNAEVINAMPVVLERIWEGLTRARTASSHDLSC
jgi:very-short-patch-repair endonuclease